MVDRAVSTEGGAGARSESPRQRSQSQTQSQGQLQISTESRSPNPWVLGVGTAVIAGIILMVVGNFVERRGSPENRSGDVTGDDSGAVSVDEEAAVGGLVLTVTDVDCGVRPPTILIPKPSGELCRIALEGANHSDVARSANEVDFVLVVGDERYPNAAGSTGEIFSRDIFPGTQARGALFFDIPEGADPTVLEVDAFDVHPGVNEVRL